jgi:hypothetical protein
MWGAKVKRIICGLFVLVLSGCANTIGMAPQEGYSGFDNARTVNLPPHGNACTGWVCTGFGAQWSDAHPDEALLIVTVFNDTTAVMGALLNIDGEKIRLDQSQAFTSFDSEVIKTSSKAYLVPLELVRRIVDAKRVWLRVETPDGTIEDAVIDGTTDSKAYHALKRFLVQIG